MKKQYIHSFYTNNEFNSFINSSNYSEPFVSDTFEENRVDYNIKKKLTFNILGDGYINWKCSTENVSKKIYCTINNSETIEIKSTINGEHINVHSGDIVSIVGDTNPCAINIDNYNTFEGSTCNFSLEGNINSIIGKENKAKLDLSDNDYIYCKLFKNCNTLQNINDLSINSRKFGIGTFYQTFYNCINISDNTLILTVSSCGNYFLYQTFYNCSSLTNSNNINISIKNCGISSFEETFYNCSSLIDNPFISCNTTSNFSFKGIFKNCSSLIEVDNINIGDLNISVFEEMFMNCSSLSKINFKLGYSYLYDSCYKRMFYNCYSLIECPSIGLLYINEEVINDPFEEMFYNASSLNNIHIENYLGETEGYFNNWVYGVANEGIFYKNANNENFSIGVNGIPVGWVNHEEDYEQLPLTFYFLENGLFKINKNKFNNSNLLYKKNNSNIINISKDIEIITIFPGDTIQLFGNISSAIDSTSKKFETDIDFIIYGNLTSLFFGEDFYSKYIDNYTATNYEFSYVFTDCNTLLSCKNLVFPKKIGTYAYYNGYRYFFNNCTKLKDTPRILPDTSRLRGGCYSYMFYNCTSLEEISPTLLPATEFMKEGDISGNFSQANYEYMFGYCTSLKTIPSGLIKVTRLSRGGLSNMFSHCSGLTSLPDDFTLPAITLEQSCYEYMFDSCISLTSLPSNLLPATNLANYCYRRMFDSCKGLISLPTGLLPATTLSYSCYENMFASCSSLASLPIGLMNATTLAKNCCQYMFNYCTGLTSLPDGFTLPATTLADYCYMRMFQGCSSLTSLPVGLLPATTLNEYCYYNMFNGCTSLTSLPEGFTLPATTLAKNCYHSMFDGCTGLTSVPANLLPATTLVYQCYYLMFNNCASLLSTPILPADQLLSGCYGAMFLNCTNLNLAICYATKKDSDSATQNFLYNVASKGTLIYNPAAPDNFWVAGSNGYPVGWNLLPKDFIYSINESNVRISKINNTYNDLLITISNDYTYTIENNSSWISNVQLSVFEYNDFVKRINILYTVSENTTGEIREDSFYIKIYDKNSNLIESIPIIIEQSNIEFTYSVNLNNGEWVKEGSIYKSDKNSYYIANGISTMRITINGYQTFKLKVKTYGENNYDYVVISELDKTPTRTNSTGGSSGNYWSGYGKSSTNWYDVTFTDIPDGEHIITIIYTKDGSSDSYDDRGYIEILS